jgi:hypothetical protein
MPRWGWDEATLGLVGCEREDSRAGATLADSPLGVPEGLLFGYRFEPCGDDLTVRRWHPILGGACRRRRILRGADGALTPLEYYLSLAALSPSAADELISPAASGAVFFAL